MATDRPPRAAPPIRAATTAPAKPRNLEGSRRTSRERGLAVAWAWGKGVEGQEIGNWQPVLVAFAPGQRPCRQTVKTMHFMKILE